MTSDRTRGISLVVAAGCRLARYVLDDISPCLPRLWYEPLGYLLKRAGSRTWRWISVLMHIDKSILAGFVVAEDLHRQACIELSHSALLIKSPTQSLPMQNPYLAIANRQFVLMQRAASELGFTPCSRARIEAGATHAPVASDWDDIAAGYNH